MKKILTLLILLLSTNLLASDFVTYKDGNFKDSIWLKISDDGFRYERADDNGIPYLPVCNAEQCDNVKILNHVYLGSRVTVNNIEIVSGSLTMYSSRKENDLVPSLRFPGSMTVKGDFSNSGEVISCYIGEDGIKENCTDDSKGLFYIDGDYYNYGKINSYIYLMGKKDLLRYKESKDSFASRVSFQWDPNDLPLIADGDLVNISMNGRKTTSNSNLKLRGFQGGADLSHLDKQHFTINRCPDSGGIKAEGKIITLDLEGNNKTCHISSAEKVIVKGTAHLENLRVNFVNEVDIQLTGEIEELTIYGADTNVTNGVHSQVKINGYRSMYLSGDIINNGLMDYLYAFTGNLINNGSFVKGISMTVSDETKTFNLENNSKNTQVSLSCNKKDEMFQLTPDNYSNKGTIHLMEQGCTFDISSFKEFNYRNSHSAGDGWFRYTFKAHANGTVLKVHPTNSHRITIGLTGENNKIVVKTPLGIVTTIGTINSPGNTVYFNGLGRLNMNPRYINGFMRNWVRPYDIGKLVINNEINVYYNFTEVVGDVVLNKNAVLMSEGRYSSRFKANSLTGKGKTGSGSFRIAGDYDVSEKDLKINARAITEKLRVSSYAFSGQISSQYKDNDPVAKKLMIEDTVSSIGLGHKLIKSGSITKALGGMSNQCLGFSLGLNESEMSKISYIDKQGGISRLMRKLPTLSDGFIANGLSTAILGSFLESSGVPNAYQCSSKMIDSSSGAGLLTWAMANPVEIIQAYDLMTVLKDDSGVNELYKIASYRAIDKIENALGVAFTLETRKTIVDISRYNIKSKMELSELRQARRRVNSAVKELTGGNKITVEGYGVDVYLPKMVKNIIDIDSGNVASMAKSKCLSDNIVVEDEYGVPQFDLDCIADHNKKVVRAGVGVRKAIKDLIPNCYATEQMSDPQFFASKAMQCLVNNQIGGLEIPTDLIKSSLVFESEGQSKNHLGEKIKKDTVAKKWKRAFILSKKTNVAMVKSIAPLNVIWRELNVLKTIHDRALPHPNYVSYLDDIQKQELSDMLDKPYLESMDDMRSYMESYISFDSYTDKFINQRYINIERSLTLLSKLADSISSRADAMRKPNEKLFESFLTVNQLVVPENMFNGAKAHSETIRAIVNHVESMDIRTIKINNFREVYDKKVISTDDPSLDSLYKINKYAKTLMAWDWRLSSNL